MIVWIEEMTSQNTCEIKPKNFNQVIEIINIIKIIKKYLICIILECRDM